MIFDRIVKNLPVVARRSDASPQLEEYIPETIWLCRYPVSYMGAELDARMTVIRLNDGHLLLHSPCAIDNRMTNTLAALGPTAYLVAPGTYHYLHIASAQAAFPAAGADVAISSSGSSAGS